jgi:hydroxyacylglutathione hydrolase
VALGAHRANVFDTPGHTRGHIVYHFAAARAAFVGDTLFAMGCGRLFEGTPGQMWSSLLKIMQWPDDTRLYCAHEYTQSNARFALTVEPQNRALQQRAATVARLRAAGQATVPTTLGEERATNPFLRAQSQDLRATIELTDAADVDVFAKTRALKDSF